MRKIYKFLCIFRNTIVESELRKYVDEYLNTLINAISEKEFIIDYHRLYPIKPDLENLCKLCPEVYPFLKHYYVFRSILKLSSTVVSEFERCIKEIMKQLSLF